MCCTHRIIRNARDAYFLGTRLMDGETFGRLVSGGRTMAVGAPVATITYTVDWRPAPAPPPAAAPAPAEAVPVAVR